MFHNRIILSKERDSKIIFMNDVDEYQYPLYNIIISKIAPSQQYDYYYIVNIDMLYFKTNEKEVSYIDGLQQLVNTTITDDIISNIKNGDALLIFDFGSEIIPISTDDETLYGKINKIFDEKGCAHGVQYWTMYSDPFSLVDKKECKVSLIPISQSTLRYIDFDYDHHKWLRNNNEIEHKSAIYLNRRPRVHRIKLFGECLKRNIDIDDTYFSFIGDSIDDNLVEEGPNDISLIRHVIENIECDQDTIDKVMNEYYGTQIFLTDHNKESWLGASSVERVTELLNHRAKSDFEVITEYSYTNIGVMISEKLSLAMLSKIPFVVLGDKGYMKRLKELGFKTFDRFWDEGYDAIDGLANPPGDNCIAPRGTDYRIIALAKTICDIQKDFNPIHDDRDNSVYTDEMNEILEHNYNHYKNVYAPALQDTMLRAVSKSEQLNYRYEVADKIWYNNINRTVVVPIPGNGMEFFNEKIADEMGYKLVNRTDIPDLDTIPAIAIIRNPLSRFENSRWWEAGMTFDAFIEKHHNTDYMKTQVSFFNGLSLWEVINLDSINTEDDINIYDSDIINNIKRIFTHEHNYSNTVINLTSEQEEILNKLFKDDIKFYNDEKIKKKKRTDNHITDQMNEYCSTIKESYPEIVECADSMTEQSEWFLDSMETKYWNDHCHILESIGIAELPKDSAILDMGTQFGTMPHFLSSIGFTDVSSTNSSVEAGSGIDDLRKGWDTLGLSVIDLHIKEQRNFHLPKKYDLILSTRTNILFKTDRILRFDNDELNENTLSLNFLSNDISEMFFVPYDIIDLTLFISNVKKFLNPGGMAVFQPYPFPYQQTIHNPLTSETECVFSKELELLSRYQTIGHSALQEKLTTHDPKIHDYFVIRN